MSSPAPDRREDVRAAIVAAGPAGVSGEDIARRLGCSRAAVHRHVEALRREGLAVSAGPGGYRVGDSTDPVSARLVEARLASPFAGPVTWRPAVGSTNDEAAALARAGAAEGTLVGADHQTAGRGRRGRHWVDRPGDALMFSLVMRPHLAPSGAGMLPLLVAVALAEGIEDTCGTRASIAWPNDLVAGDRKVAGILIELSADQERISWAVAGVGVNVRSAPAVDDARWTPGCLADDGPPPSRSDLLVSVLAALGRRYHELAADGGAAVRGLFAARDHLGGRRITVALPGREVTGTAHGIDDIGRLRVATREGEELVGAGEVVRVRGRSG